MEEDPLPLGDFNVDPATMAAQPPARSSSSPYRALAEAGWEGLRKGALLPEDWARALTHGHDSLAPQLDAVLRAVAEREAAGEEVLPQAAAVFAALSVPLNEVRVMILGQDPYPTPGHAMGLSFATDPSVSPLPRSLANIYKELSSDLRIPPARHGDLRPWREQGVLLLNRVLTVGAGRAGSHRRLGWETFTEAVIRAVVARRRPDGSRPPLVSILWGKDAQAALPLLEDTAVVSSVHPSPLSASRGFFGSRPFSAVNELLLQQGAEPIQWALEHEPIQPSLLA